MVSARRGFLVLPLLFVLLPLSAACDKRLSTAEAERVIAAYPNANVAGTIRAEGVSQAEGSNEAIARIAFGNRKLNAKLRRFDTGWQWEFVETTAGTWLPPDKALSDIREALRLERVAQWRDANLKQYSISVESLDYYAGDLYLARNPDYPLSASWTKLRQTDASLLRDILTKPWLTPSDIADHERRLLRVSVPQVDAWGHELLAGFDDGKRVAAFRSIGPDGRKETADDITCVARGVREWDDNWRKSMFNYEKSWTLPEGLEAAVKPLLDKRGRSTVEYARVVQ